MLAANWANGYLGGGRSTRYDRTCLMKGRFSAATRHPRRRSGPSQPSEPFIEEGNPVAGVDLDRQAASILPQYRC